MLKSQGIKVRGLVRNVSKARDLLKCTKCDESEGIYVADITKPETLTVPMAGTTKLVIATSANAICEPSTGGFPHHCHYPQGSFPKDIDWQGGKNQLIAFAEQTKGKGQAVLISAMGTTSPDGPHKWMSNGTYNGFYKLEIEAFLMSTGLQYTIVKPCGLFGPGNNTLVVGHDDELRKLHPTLIAKVDVSRVVVTALQHPEVAAGLRFALCSKAGPATSDSALVKVLEDAKYPWQQAPADIQI
jgi:uncharacterized protein YbjT (DUF2867 family)